MSKDILLYESGSGGELLVLNNDVSLVETLLQQVYLMLFAGQLEANTTGNEIAGRERDDWWGNALLFADSDAKKFNSNTERVLDSVAMNTAGRIDITRAVEDDLKSLEVIADVFVNVVILSHSKIKIEVKLQKPGDLESKVFQYIWDNASNEVIIQKII